MKLEIELDLNKIDYDSINKQLAEKVAKLNIKDEYDIDSEIDSKINKLVSNEVDRCYNDYLERYWGSPTSEGKRLVENITKAEIEKRVIKVTNELFDTVYTDDFLKELMIKMLPDIFTYVIIGKIETGLIMKDETYQSAVHSVIRNEIENRLNTRY